ncbi:PCSK4 convertase, partial [Polypterus senegalus]
MEDRVCSPKAGQGGVELPILFPCTEGTGTRRGVLSPMRRIGFFILFATLGFYLGQCALYTNSWVVRISGPLHSLERHGFINLGKVFPGDNYHHIKHRGLPRISLRKYHSHNMRLKREPRVLWFEQQTVQVRKRRHLTELPTDPLFEKQWYLSKDFHLNVTSAWDKGFTGKGVVVTIVDDGIEKNHPDLITNYDPDASYDFVDNDADPLPRYTSDNENGYGLWPIKTGVRMIDGLVTDIMEAQSFSLNPQHIHIYSASWGPEDDGKTVSGPGRLAKEVFLRGVTYGRNGLGSIFVWASGNGGSLYDNCNCDGYSSSIFTVSVSSTTEAGTVPWYSEACSSTLTTAYSGGDRGQRKIVTTDLRHRCTQRHSGTSASAPLVAGIIALALEAKKIPRRMVVLMNVSGCQGSKNFIRSLEHVQVQLSLSYSRRGDLAVTLTSPGGTRSVLVTVRPLDNSRDGYSDWPFMTIHSWDEDPRGVWTLELQNKGDYRNRGGAVGTGGFSITRKCSRAKLWEHRKSYQGQHKRSLYSESQSWEERGRSLLEEEWRQKERQKQREEEEEKGHCRMVCFIVLVYCAI